MTRTNCLTIRQAMATKCSPPPVPATVRHPGPVAGSGSPRQTPAPPPTATAAARIHASPPATARPPGRCRSRRPAQRERPRWPSARPTKHPARIQRWGCGETASHGGNSSGKQRHGATARTIQQRALTTSRGPWASCGASGCVRARQGVTNAHSSSVTSDGHDSQGVAPIPQTYHVDTRLEATALARRQALTVG